MRKFFKSLAVLLALTLIVGVIPAAAADSLSMQKEKVLYLDGSKGQKEDGTQCKTSSKKLVANMIKGFDKDTMSVVLSSADKDIVKTTKAGRIVAKSLGTTTVTVTVLNAADEQIFKQDLKVKVKKNATDVTVTGIADGDKFSVGQTVDVTLPRAGVDTDERDLTVDNTDVAEITAGTSARTYTVKFLKAGEATFTAKAFQSTKYPAKTADKVIKVTVGNPVPTSVKAVASNAFELTFAEDIEALGLFKDVKEIPNDAVYYMINDTKVTQSAAKAVKATGNIVKITMYDNFAAGKDYFVVINGSDALGFKIAGTAAKDVESIAILSSTAVVNTASKIDVALYNADGVDITSSVGTANITLTSSNLSSYADGLTLNMYNVGDVTDLTATFTYYDANDNYKEVKKTATKKITAVAASADVFDKVVYTINGDGNAATTWMTSKTYIALGDNTLDFKAIVTFKNNGVSTNVVVGKTGEPQFNGKNLIAWIPEEATAILLPATGLTGCYRVQPNTVGRTNVFIGYANDDGSKTTLTVCPIEVKEGRYPASLTVSPSKSTLNNSSLIVGGDSVTLRATVKDQYGDAITNASFATSQNTQSQGVVPVTTTDLEAADWTNNFDGTYDLTILGSSITYPTSTKNGNVVLTVKLTNWNSKAPTVGVNFSVKDDGLGQNTVDDAIAFVNNGEAKLDTTITGTTQYKAAKLAATTSRNGFYTGKVGFALIDTVPTVAKTVTGPAAVFQLLIKKDGTTISGDLGATANSTDGTIWSNFIKVNTTNGTVNVINFFDDGTTIYKLPAGNYQFTLFKLTTVAGKNAGEGVVSSQTIVINVADNQKAPTYVQKDEVATYTKAVNRDFSECFKFNFEGSEYNPTTGFVCGSAAVNTNSFFVQKCNVVVTINVQDKTGLTLGTPATLTKGLDCTINKLIKTK